MDRARNVEGSTRNGVDCAVNHWLLCALVGATLIIVRGTIFARIRRNVLPSLLGCSQCVGFWVGFAAGAWNYPVLSASRWLNAAIVGCIVSFAAMVADIVLLKLADGPKEDGHA